MESILVIGGGITGLTTMYELQKWKKMNKSNVKLMLVESNSYLGGKIHTEKDEQFLMETGADSLVARKMKTFPYIEELGLHNKIVYNSSGTSFLYVDEELKQIPKEAVFGIPASVESLATTPLVSAEGKVAALKDLYTENEIFTKDDAIGDFLEYFLGKELVEKQIAPVLSGVYSGKLNELTIAATLPFLLEYKNKYGSIMRGLEANKEKYISSDDKKFFSFENGLMELINGFKESFDQVELFLNKEATGITKLNNGRYYVTFQTGDRVEVDQIVLSIPHTQAEKLFNNNTLTSYFRPFESSSLISVYLGYNVPNQILPNEGTGFIATVNSDLWCNACTWTSKKWQHTSRQGNLLVRLFYKSNSLNFSKVQQMSEDELIGIAREDIMKSLGITNAPFVSEVTKWMDTMPKYQITHAKDIEQLDRELTRQYPGVWIAGCSYYGVGIPDCIENGKTTAEKVLGHMVGSLAP